MPGHITAIALSGFKFIPSAGELGLFRGLALSQARLNLSAFGLFAANMAYGFVVRDFILNRSADIGVNMFLIALQFLFVVVAGYVIAMAAASAWYGERWRRRVLLGEKVDIDEVQADAAAVGMLSDNTFAFYGMVLAAAAISFVSVMAATQNYISDYNQHGFYLALLRSDTPSDQIDGLRGLVNPLNAESIEDDFVRGRVVELLGSDDEEVRIWAAWTSGHLLVTDARDGLMAMLADGSVEEQVQAAESLGRLSDPIGERQMIEMLPAAAPDDDLSVGLLRGLGLMRSRDAAEPVSTLLSEYGPEARPVAMWALGQAGDSSVRDHVLALWSDQNLELQCGVAEALKYLAGEPQLEMLERAFDETPRDYMCEANVLHGRSYDEHENFLEIEVVMGEELRMKYLKAIFNIAGPGLEEWLYDVYMDETESIDMRNLAGRLIEAIRLGEPRTTRE